MAATLEASNVKGCRRRPPDRFVRYAGVVCNGIELREWRPAIRRGVLKRFARGEPCGKLGLDGAARGLAAYDAAEDAMRSDHRRRA
jgi:hypothetical protein